MRNVAVGYSLVRVGGEIRAYVAVQARRWRNLAESEASMRVEIEIKHLTKSFGKQLIWGDATLPLPAGEICVMLGPSGTGKSVLLKTLIGLLKPDRGSVVIEGVDITTCPERQLYEI